MFLDVSTEFVKKGFSTILFDHIGCGYSDGNFRDFLLSDAIKNIGIIFEWMCGQPFCREGEIFLLGQSLGTATAIEALAADSGLAGFILWNLSADFARRYPRLFGPAMSHGKSVCIEDKGLFTHPDFIADAKRFAVIDRFAEVRCPVLFLNSGSDEKADLGLARAAAERMVAPFEMRMIQGANHSFKGQPELEAAAIQHSINWAKKILSCDRVG